MLLQRWLLLFIATSFFYALTFVPRQAAPDDARRKTRRTLAYIGLAIGFALGLYYGVLHAVMPARPFWNTPLLPFLFLFSAYASGIAGVILLRGLLHKKSGNADAESQYQNSGYQLLAWILALSVGQLVLLFTFILFGAGFADASMRQAVYLIMPGGVLATDFWAWVVLVTQAQIEDLAHQFGITKPAALVWGMNGIGHHYNGSVASILGTVLNVITGNFETPGGVIDTELVKCNKGGKAKGKFFLKREVKRTIDGNEVTGSQDELHMDHYGDWPAGWDDVVGDYPRRFLEGVSLTHPFFKGGIVTMSALSGIDQALYDLKAKSLNIPLWQLLGGQCRKKVRMYDHLGGGDKASVYESADGAAFAQKAAQSRADGFSALKILAVGKTAPLDGLKALKRAERLMAAAREGAGEGMDIMVDLHGRTNAAMAIQYIKVLEPYRPYFIEEPCQPEDHEGIARVAGATNVPVAAGERLVHRHEFLPLLKAGAIAIAQPDLCHAGGLSEVRRIATLCDTYGVLMAPHNPLGPVATMVNIHFGIATSNFLMQEVMRADVEWRDEVVSGVTPIIDGHVKPETKAGIGVEINMKAAKEHPFEEVVPVQWYHDDGSVADW